MDMQIEKIPVMAKAVWDDGIDGRDAHYDVQYSCPKCGKIIGYRDIACDECGTFFKWNGRARIEMKPTIVWE